jgi:hypothetical protein
VKRITYFRFNISSVNIIGMQDQEKSLSWFAFEVGVLNLNAGIGVQIQYLAI